MKIFRLLLILNICGFTLGAFAAPLKSAKARIALFKESMEKQGADFVLRRDKVCYVENTLNVFDLTSSTKVDYTATWKDLCEVTVDGVKGMASYSSDIMISNLDLFSEGKTTVYRNLFLNFGWGSAGSPFMVLGSNVAYEQDLTAGKKMTLKVSGQGPHTLKEKLSLVIEVED